MPLVGTAASVTGAEPVSLIRRELSAAGQCPHIDRPDCIPAGPVRSCTMPPRLSSACRGVIDSPPWCSYYAFRAHVKEEAP